MAADATHHQNRPRQEVIVRDATDYDATTLESFDLGGQP